VLERGKRVKERAELPANSHRQRLDDSFVKSWVIRAYSSLRLPSEEERISFLQTWPLWCADCEFPSEASISLRTPEGSSPRKGEAMKAMNMIRAAILVGILGASPSSAVSAVPGTPDAYPIRNQMVYDEEGTRDAYPIRNQMVYDENGTRDAYPIRNQLVYDENGTRDAYPIRNQMVYDEGTRDAYPIRNQMVYDEDNSAFQSWLRQWSASLLVRLGAYVR
jgi:hypothetical protein